MIELAGIRRVFELGGAPVNALDGVSLVIPSGSYVAIMGPSGSGKSTLLNILGLLDRPTDGSYRLEGRETSALDDDERTRLRRHAIGFIFQTFHLVPRLTALGNVELPMVFAGLPRADRLEKARAALDAVGLMPRASHRQGEMSGGERQRVAIARAVVMSPSILLADEPTGNLDRAAAGEVMRLLESLNGRGLTLILVTHDAELGARARRLIRLRDGRVVEDRDTGPAEAA
jgi:putative ABC transport system ATP-binding protein